MAMDLSLDRVNDGYIARFSAMACDCEVLLEINNEYSAKELSKIVYAEARRIETKFSRYRSDNIIHAINNSKGIAVSIDKESHALLDFADKLYHLSDGLFDITSGILRKAWHFDGSDQIPQQKEIDALLPQIGWSKVQLTASEIRLPAGMEIDLGGIGKEFAVDHCLALVSERTEARVLVNFGGDLACNGQKGTDKIWTVGVRSRQSEDLPLAIRLQSGALATSGDMHRFLLRNEKRYSHILDPTTGWPVEKTPVSVTVAAPTCAQAGSLATLAMLQGAQAGDFLNDLKIEHWIQHE